MADFSSPTDTIVRAMEEAATMETVIIVFRCKNEEALGIVSNTEDTALKVGLLESAKLVLFSLSSGKE